MARLDRDHTIALQAAEAALRDAELDIRTSLGPSPFTIGTAARNIAPNAPGVVNFSCSCGRDLAATQQGLCLPLSPATACTANPWETQANWSGTGSVPLHTFTHDANTTDLPLVSTYANGSSQLPRYLIEILPNTDSGLCSAKIGTTCPSNRYRLTARGWGPNGTYATVQETFQP